MTNRPALVRTLAPDVFLDWYWLKSELAKFCRAEKLPAHGSKAELTQRIAAYLETGKRVEARPPSRPVRNMPASFTLETVIGPGWRCSGDLRRFLQQHLGAGFRFDAVMRDYVLRRPGSTLAQAIAASETARASPGASDILPQFEFNRFTRSYREAHPSASREDVVRAWKAHRGKPRSSRES